MTGDCIANICILKQEKKIEDVLHASNNLKQAHLIFLNIKRVKIDDIVTLLAHVTILDDVYFFSRVSQSSIQIEARRKNSNIKTFFCSTFFFFANANSFYLFWYFLYVNAVFLNLVIFMLHDFKQTWLPENLIYHQ